MKELRRGRRSLCPVLTLWRVEWGGAERVEEAELTYLQLMETKLQNTSMIHRNDTVHWLTGLWSSSELLPQTLADTSVTMKQLWSWQWSHQVTSCFSIFCLKSISVTGDMQTYFKHFVRLNRMCLWSMNSHHAPLCITTELWHQEHKSFISLWSSAAGFSQTMSDYERLQQRASFIIIIIHFLNRFLLL